MRRIALLLLIPVAIALVVAAVACRSTDQPATPQGAPTPTPAKPTAPYLGVTLGNDKTFRIYGAGDLAGAKWYFMNAGAVGIEIFPQLTKADNPSNAFIGPVDLVQFAGQSGLIVFKQSDGTELSKKVTVPK